MNPVILFLFVVIGILGSCKKDNPVKPENQSPIITSVVVFPEVIGPNDSVLVVCNAMDPDGDTLVYDWLTDARLRIKGTNFRWLYHTKNNSRIFYPTGVVKLPRDTVWVECSVRDVKGGADRKVVTIIVDQNAERRY